MTIENERLREFIAYTKLSVRAFETKCGIPNSYVATMNVLTSDKLKKISDAFPELNVEWLLFGVGEMTKKIETPASQDLLSALRETIDAKSSLIDMLKEKLSASDERLESYRKKTEEMQLIIDEYQKNSKRENNMQSPEARV